MPTNSPDPQSSITDNLSAQARETLAQGRERAGKALASSRETAGKLYDDAKDRSYRLADATNRLVQEHPLATAAIAVAAGAAIAALFPRVRSAALTPLKDVAQRALAAIDTDALRSKAGDVAGEARVAAESAGSSAAQGAAQLRDRATQILTEASKAVASRIDAEALKTQALDAAAKAGELAGDMLHKASKAASEAAKKAKP